MCALMLQLYLCLLDQGNGESSQARNPPVESTHVEDVDDDSESESSKSEFQYADSDY
jgi:hypothetical protein